MLQIVLGQKQPVPVNCIHHFPPNIYCAVNSHNNNNESSSASTNEQRQPDHKGVSIEYSAAVSFASNNNNNKSVSDSIRLATKQTIAKRVFGDSLSTSSSSKTSSSAASKKLQQRQQQQQQQQTKQHASGDEDNLNSEFFIQWNLTRCLPFLRRPVTVLVELLEEEEDVHHTEEIQNSTNENNKENKQNDDDDTTDDASTKLDEETKKKILKRNKKVTLIVPGMMTNTNTKDTIWIGRFDLDERLKSIGNATTSTNKIFNITLVRMIIGSHMLISPDKQTYTVVVPLPNSFLQNQTNNNRHHHHLKNELDETEFASVETVSLPPSSSSSTTAASNNSPSSSSLFLNIKNSILIRAATEKRQQVEVISGLNVYKRKDHVMREKRKQMKLANNKPVASNFGSFSCSLENSKALQVAELLLNNNNKNNKSTTSTNAAAAAASTSSGMDLVIEMSLGSENQTYPSSSSSSLNSKFTTAIGGGGTMTNAANSKMLIWFIIAAVGFALIGVITHSLMQLTNSMQSGGGEIVSNSNSGNDEDL